MVDLGDAGLTPAARRRGLLAAISSISVVGIAMGITYPLLSLLLEARGVSATLNGLNGAMPAIAILLFSPFVPAFARRFGVRRSLLLFLATEAGAVLCLKLFDDLWLWFPIRFVLGVSAAGLFIVSETWINQAAPDAIRGRVMAIYNMVLSGAFAVGPLIIAGIGIFGWPPFLIAIFAIVAAGVPLMFASGTAPDFAGPKSRFNAFGFVRVAPSLVAAVFVFAVIESAASGLLPVYGVRNGFSTESAATLITVTIVGTIAFQLPVGWLADKMDRYGVMWMCGVVTLLCSLALPFTVDRTWLLWLDLLLLGGLGGGIYTVALTILGERFKGAELMTANAAFGLMWGVGLAIGPTLAGAAMDVWDPHGFAVVLTLGSVVFVIVTGLRRLSKRRADA